MIRNGSCRTYLHNTETNKEEWISSKDSYYTLYIFNINNNWLQNNIRIIFNIVK